MHLLEILYAISLCTKQYFLDACLINLTEALVLCLQLQCTYIIQVTFRNELTGEYLYYLVTFKSTPPGIMGTVELTTPVRKSTSHHITLSNPLPSTITVTTNTNVSDISLPSSFIVGAQSEVRVSLFP